MKIDPTAETRQNVYRLMIRTVVPRPIAWVSTRSVDGVSNLAPFSFFTAIAPDPPTVCFAPAKRSDGAPKDTLANVTATREFVVNVVTEALAERMNETATDYPAGIDEFERAGLTPVAGERVGAPRVAESPVQMECSLLDIVPVGESGAVLVVGRVLLFHIDDSVLRNGKVDPGALAAVGRMGGTDYSRTRDRFTLLRKPYVPDE